ncbi:PilN domain-containing protein [Lysobacter sp. GX 14042]|uniref:PilN domain-containing protein n=1 Tax=Lysobacter sp. GX 14042 TaxID=2907155 RepID=UPI001F3DB72B|nr:PilN domain-containing protein [Lysobacter sp. GX 14042]MCE7033469.1 PilN domain-containing protein [Lysobacter sp. GX 14042]
MARINLLPWRAERRRQRQKEAMGTLALAVLGAVLLSFVIISWHNSQIDGQRERNDYLKAQIATVDEQIKEIDALDVQKARLLARKEVIEKLQANRSQMVHLFDSLVRTIPDGVVLTSLKQDSETLTLDGRAQSNTRVSTYMRNLEGSGWMTRPELSIIEAKGFEQGLPYQFTLTVKLANPNAPLDEDGDGIPDPAPPVSEALALEAGEPASDTAAEPGAADAADAAPADAEEGAAGTGTGADSADSADSADAAEPVEAEPASADAADAAEGAGS